MYHKCLHLNVKSPQVLTILDKRDEGVRGVEMREGVGMRKGEGGGCGFEKKCGFEEEVRGEVV